MIHAPLDFLLTTAFLGCLFGATLHALSNWVTRLNGLRFLSLAASEASSSVNVGLLFAALWVINQFVRRIRLSFSPIFERRASATLLGTESLQAVLMSSFVLATLAAFFAFARLDVAAVLAGLAAILLTRYLFFVSVVPLNMALTFVRGGRH